MALKSVVSTLPNAAKVVLVAFGILKLAILIRYGALQANDTPGYQAVADAMQHDPSFWWTIPDWTTTALPTYAFRPIGYPLLLVATHAWTLTVLVQIGLALTVAYMLSRIVHEATASTFLTAAAPALYLGGETLLWDNSILCDSFYAALFNIVILTLLRTGLLNRTLSLKLLLALGFAWGYSTWVRENGLFLTVIPVALVLLVPGQRFAKRLAAGVTFLVPIVMMVGLYAGWNHARTGETFFGITGTANYLHPVFEMAKAGADPFSDQSLLSRTARELATDYSYPDQVAVLEAVDRETGLDPLALGHLVLTKFVSTVAEHPVAYGGVVLQNCNPLRVAPVLFDPLATINDFYQVGVPPFERVIPGTGLKDFVRLARLHDGVGFALAVAALIGQVLSTGLFLFVICRNLLKAVVALKRRTALPADNLLGLQGVVVFLMVLVSFALIHAEARYLLSIIPVFLIGTAVALKRPNLADLAF